MNTKSMFQGLQCTSVAPISRFLHLIKAFRESKVYVGAFLFKNLKGLTLLQFTFYCTIPLLCIHSSSPLILQLPIFSLSHCTFVDASQHHKQTNTSQLQCSLTFLFLVIGYQSAIQKSQPIQLQYSFYCASTEAQKAASLTTSVELHCTVNWSNQFFTT